MGIYYFSELNLVEERFSYYGNKFIALCGADKFLDKSLDAVKSFFERFKGGRATFGRNASFKNMYKLLLR